jgi:hypothetical protein
VADFVAKFFLGLRTKIFRAADASRKRGCNFSGLAPVNVPLVLHWSEYSTKAIAQVQARGMPIDMVLWNLVQENKTAVIRDLVHRYDPSQGTTDPIYTDEGQWEYARFARWLIDNGIAWPRLPSDQLDTDEDAFGLMTHVPGINGLYALKTGLHVIRSVNLLSRRNQSIKSISLRYRNRAQCALPQPI